MIIIIIITLFAVVALLSYIVWRKRDVRNRILTSMEQLAATMQMQNSRIQKIPNLILTVKYRTYPIVAECSIARSGSKGVERWSFSTRLTREIPCRFYVQGEASEGKLRKVMGLDLVQSADAEFDGKVLIFSSRHETAIKIFNPYLRHRFLWAGFTDFVMDVNGTFATFETNMDIMTNVRYVRHALEVWTEFLNILESV